MKCKWEIPRLSLTSIITCLDMLYKKRHTIIYGLEFLTYDDNFFYKFYFHKQNLSLRYQNIHRSINNRLTSLTHIHTRILTRRNIRTNLHTRTRTLTCIDGHIQHLISYQLLLDYKRNSLLSFFLRVT